jgi:general secretion pathway protein G
MASAGGNKHAGFTLYEFAVSGAVLAVLAGLLLSRAAVYQEEAERVAVQELVGTLRRALQLHASGLRDHQRATRQLLEDNPLDWLARKPDNYLGEFYSPDLEKMPHGNWLFDRRDKCLVYLLDNHKSFYFRASKLLKFKVEFARLQGQAAQATSRTREVYGALILAEVGQASAETEK